MTYFHVNNYSKLSMIIDYSFLPLVHKQNLNIFEQIDFSIAFDNPQSD